MSVTLVVAWSALGCLRRSPLPGGRLPLCSTSGLLNIVVALAVLIPLRNPPRRKLPSWWRVPVRLLLVRQGLARLAIGVVRLVLSILGLVVARVWNRNDQCQTRDPD
jgi:hypothetical protein